VPFAARSSTLVQTNGVIECRDDAAAVMIHRS